MSILPKHKNRKEIPEYRVWKAMRARVSNGCKGNDSYKEKGISVCERWNDFELFYLDMGPRPSNKHSIDRKDNSKDYFPENCRWTNQTVQCSNRGDFNKIFIHNGEPKVLKAIAKDVGIGYTTLYSRIYVHGIPFEEAIIKKNKNKSITLFGKDFSLVDICNKYNLSYSAVLTYQNRHKEKNIQEVLGFYGVIIKRDDIV
jgi:hypothetical protein